MTSPVVRDSSSRRDLWEEAASIRSGELTATELVQGHQRNIARLNERYNVFVHLDGERTLEEASTLDAEAKEGRFRGPLHGIPVAIKDNIDTVGFDTTAGSRVLKGNRPEADAPLVSRLREAGAIISGKTNMDEFAYGFSTENEHYGNVLNPYDPERVAGGSSGGSAVPVVLGMSAGAIGTDTNGSIRVPASLCGLVGLRPTYGRVSRRGIVPLAASLDQAGPLTRSVRDAALILSVISDQNPSEATSRDAPTPYYAESLEEPTSSLKIGVPGEYFFEDADPEALSIVETGLKKLAGEDQDLIEIRLPQTQKGRGSAALITAVESTEAVPDEMIENYGHLFDRKVLDRIKARTGISVADYEKAREHANAIKTELLDTFEGVDVIVTPTCPLPAVLVGEEPREIGGVTVSPNRYLGAYTSAFGLAGLPAISVPCGFTSGGLPVGLQLIGAPFGETELVRLALLFERLMRSIIVSS